MHDSDHKIINCDVPQGFILGPLLYIMYINDIVNTTSLLELSPFADDTTLLLSHPDIAHPKLWNTGYVIGFRLISYLSMQVKPITRSSVLIIVQQNPLMQIRTRIHWIIPNQHILEKKKYHH